MERNGAAEIQTLLARQQNTQTQWNQSSPGSPLKTPGPYTSSNYYETTTDYPHGDLTDIDPCSDEVLESARSYDSEGPYSATLNNKGIPYMFPVTEGDYTTDFQSDFPSDFMSDFTSEREDSPPPYGSPVPSYRGKPLDPTAVVSQAPTEGDTSASATPTSPLSPEPCPRMFTFYHRDVRLGQTQQFSTFRRSQQQ